MSKVILYISVSVDGYIAKADGDISWLTPYTSEGEDLDYQNFYAGVGTIIAGAATYRDALKLGPWPAKDRLTYVITHKPFPVSPDALIQPYSGDLKALVAAIKARYKKNIWLMGGANLAQQFLREQLLEELMLFRIPTLLGSGLSLFSKTEREIPLSLQGTKAYKSGIVLEHYLPAPSGFWE